MTKHTFAAAALLALITSIGTAHAGGQWVKVDDYLEISSTGVTRTGDDLSATFRIFGSSVETFTVDRIFCGEKVRVFAKLDGTKGLSYKGGTLIRDTMVDLICK